MQLITSFVKSISDLEWLKAQKNQVGRAWGYFAVLFLAASFISAIPATLSIHSLVKDFKEHGLTQVPNFTAEVKNGALTVSGVEQPFTRTIEDDGDQFVFYIDTATSAPASVKEVLSGASQSGILVTQNKFEVYDATGDRTESYDWKNVPNSTLTRDQVEKAITFLNGPTFVILSGLFFFVIFFIGDVIAGLVSLLFITAILTLISLVAQKGWRFSDLFVVGLFASTLPTIISLVATLVGVPIPFIHSLALLAFMLAVVFTKDEGVAIEQTPKV